MAKRKPKNASATAQRETAHRSAKEKPSAGRAPLGRSKRGRASAIKKPSAKRRRAPSAKPNLKAVLVPQTTSTRASAPKIVETILTFDEAAGEYVAREEELTRQKAAIERILARPSVKAKLESAEWKAKYGNYTYHVGLRTKFGRPVSPLRFVLEIRFENKLSDDELAAQDRKMFPPKVYGIPVKVLESRPRLAVGVWPNNPPPLTNNVIGGVPCAPAAAVGPDKPWGTLGVCINQGGNWTGLTNHHVASGAGTSVAQLGPAVGSSAPLGTVSSSYIGDVTYSYGTFSIDGSAINLSGLVGRTAESLIRQWETRWGTKLWFPDAEMIVGPLDTNGRVFVYGAMTETLLRGRLENPSYNSLPVGGLYFNNIIRIVRDGTFVQGGDSGSLLLLEIEKDGGLQAMAVGLVFARDDANSRIGYACHMRPVLDHLNLTVTDVLDDWVTPRP
jgi:hypothetical protein